MMKETGEEEKIPERYRWDRLADLYEGLLEKNASETKSGAGQYFTPRPLIDLIVNLVSPKPGERLCDPAAGTFGFMIATDHFLKKTHDNYEHLTPSEQMFQATQALSGMELVPKTHKLALMNALLHNLEPKLACGNSLSSEAKWMKGFDVVLTNPPFGSKKGDDAVTRDDITYTTGNKQLNFLQIIYNMLKPGGRAAVVLPDNVLFESGVGEKIRLDLLNKCNLHTVLRLPTGIFYAKGVQTNVLFFQRGFTDENNTEQTYFYDMRSDSRTYGKTAPLTNADFHDFVTCYRDRDTKNQRWKAYTIEEIKARDNTSLDITWLETKNSDDDVTLSLLLDTIKEKAENISSATEQIYELLKNIEE